MITVPMGYTQSKEYAEPEWLIDILIAVVWVSYGIVFFGTLARRRIKNIYVACWYYGAFIVAVGMMHIINNLVLPISLTRSVPIYSGVVDAMVQWWYGHNAVAFILTAGFLGMMYYFVPRQAQQPLWSYRFSIVNFCIYVGRCSPPYVYRSTRLGAISGYGVFYYFGNAKLGVCSQRFNDL